MTAIIGRATKNIGARMNWFLANNGSVAKHQHSEFPFVEFPGAETVEHFATSATQIETIAAHPRLCKGRVRISVIQFIEISAVPALPQSSRPLRHCGKG